MHSLIKGHRKFGVISVKNSRDMTNQISPPTVNVFYIPVTAT